MNRLVELFFGNVLDVFVDGQDEILARFGLGLDIGEPLFAGVDGDEHLAGLAPELLVELMLDAAQAGVFHPD